jgi:aminopeptidase N
MSTLITGERPLGSLVGVSVHELMHSWYQFVLATNESLYPWMDEGFTSFASAEVMKHLAEIGAIPGAEVEENPHLGTVLGYSRFANTGRAEALSTHADHYTTNAAYGVGSYVKGELFLYQLGGIIGEEAFDKGMLRYFNTWKMKHPTPQDFMRVMEKVSGQELDWYLEYMVNTTHQIDFAVDTVYSAGAKKTTVVLRKLGVMPAPVDVLVRDRDGKMTTFLIPIVLQRGHAPLKGRQLAPDWPWTNPTYTLTVPMPFDRIAGIEVDPEVKLSESNKENNVYPPLVIEEN